MWIIEENAGLNVHVKSFPVGYAFINVISGENFQINQSGKGSIHTQSYVTGQAVKPFNLSMRFIKRSLVINLRPYSFFSFFGIPLSELQGNVYCLKEIAPLLGSKLEELIESSLTSKLVLESVDQLFKEHLKKVNLDPRLVYAVNQIKILEGKVQIKQLSETANLSQRRLQQLFKDHMGVTAKTYCRIMRLQSLSFEVLKDAKLDYLIPDNYFDQAHFIHDIKSQTRMTPTKYVEYITAPERHMAYMNSNPYAS